MIRFTCGLRGQPVAAFVCPGHPLLDAVLDLTLERHRALVKRGAVLVDELDHGLDPRVLVHLEHAVFDGRPTRVGRERFISKRTICLDMGPEGVRPARVLPWSNAAAVCIPFSPSQWREAVRRMPGTKRHILGGRLHALAIGGRLLRKAHAMHCSTSPSHSTASPWMASGSSRAMITHGPSGGSRRGVGSHPGCNQGAASTVSRHARRAPVPPPSATASTATGSSSGATMRAFRMRGPCGCASTSSCHVSSGSRKGAGTPSAPAAAISRPNARVTSSGIPERSVWR
ncbi:MAG: hypothetical protein F4Y07_02925 [Gemmatimonadetes bacterium]|nr:hypothetical protein [Gemmatimonadota bacterium]